MVNLRKPDSASAQQCGRGFYSSLMESYPHWYLREYNKLNAPERPVGISLRGGAVHRRLVISSRGVAEVDPEGLFAPAVVLNFLHSGGMAARLAGGQAFILPLPAGPRVVGALRLFSALSGNISGIMASSFQAGSDEYSLQTKMLLTAALRGVCEVALWDSWVRVKAARLPLGILEVIAGDPESPDFRGYILRESGRHGVEMRYAPSLLSAGIDGEPDTGISESFPTGRPTARLSFDTLEIAGDVLRGRTSAMECLGRGSVGIRGKIPYIQGIFPLLDRFSEIMNSAQKEE
jgi:hypothetical protein